MKHGRTLTLEGLLGQIDRAPRKRARARQLARSGEGERLEEVNLGSGSATLTELDTFAISEANNPAFATGFGSLSVHEVATDKTDASRAYLSYYQGGMRSLQIQCSNPGDRTTCRLVEVGGYLDPLGNNFWGIETFTRGGTTYVAGSDMDSGLWLFKRKP